MPLESRTNDLLDALSSMLQSRAIQDLILANSSDPSQISGLHDNRGPGLEIAVWVLTSFAFLFLALRVYCKWLTHRGLFGDDWTLIGAWVILFATAIMETVAIRHGFGKHEYAIDLKHVNTVALTSQIASTSYVTSQAWSKTSFAMTIYRLSDPRMKKLILMIMVTINILTFIACLFFWIQCQPISKSWRPLVQGTCWNPQINVKIGIVGTAWSGLWDVAFALFPWKVIMNVQMDLRKRIGVALAMSMGVFAGTCAFIKCSFLHLQAEHDFTYEGVALVVWGIAEAAVTIMAASIPVMRVLLRETISSHNYRSGQSAPVCLTSGETKPGQNVICVQTHISISKSDATARLVV